MILVAQKLYDFGLQMESMASPEDPLFYLHHNFIDYQWALWQGNKRFTNVHIFFAPFCAVCQGYDTVEQMPTKDSNIYAQNYKRTDLPHALGDSLQYKGFNEWSNLYKLRQKHGQSFPKLWDMHKISDWDVQYGDLFFL